MTEGKGERRLRAEGSSPEAPARQKHKTEDDDDDDDDTDLKDMIRSVKTMMKEMKGDMRKVSQEVGSAMAIAKEAKQQSDTIVQSLKVVEDKIVTLEGAMISKEELPGLVPDKKIRDHAGRRSSIAPIVAQMQSHELHDLPQFKAAMQILDKPRAANE